MVIVGNCYDHVCLMPTELKLMLLEFISNEISYWGCDEVDIPDTPKNREIFLSTYGYEYEKSEYEQEHSPTTMTISMGSLVDYWKNEIETQES